MILSDEYAHNTTDMNRITFEVPGLVHKESDNDSEAWVLALDGDVSTDINASLRHHRPICVTTYMETSTVQL